MTAAVSFFLHYFRIFGCNVELVPFMIVPRRASLFWHDFCTTRNTLFHIDKFYAALALKQQQPFLHELYNQQTWQKIFSVVPPFPIAYIHVFVSDQKLIHFQADVFIRIFRMFEKRRQSVNWDQKLIAPDHFRTPYLRLFSQCPAREHQLCLRNHANKNAECYETSWFWNTLHFKIITTIIKRTIRGNTANVNPKRIVTNCVF